MSFTGSETDLFVDCLSQQSLPVNNSGVKRSRPSADSTFVSPEYKIPRMANANAQDNTSGSENSGSMESVDIWESTFGEAKGYPTSFSKFAKDLNDTLVPNFAKEAQKLFYIQSAPIRNNITSMERKVNDIMQGMCCIRIKSEINKTKIQENRDMILRSEAERRANNLLFIGFPEVPREKAQDCIDKVCEEIQKIEDIDMDCLYIQRCYRVGRRSETRPRDILVQFLEYPTKQRVSQGRDAFSSHIKVRQDLPPELASIQRALMPIKRIADNIPKYRNQVIVTMGELKIQDKRYTLRNLHEIPDDINISLGTFKMNDSLYVYFSVLNIFSNFRWAPINLDGIIYEMNEKYIQFSKSRCFKDENTAAMILEMDNPFEIKKLGYQVRGFKKDIWDKKAVEVAMKCNDRKFRVHYDMAQFLMSTHPRELAEASEEDPWGCGVKLSSDDVLNRDNWKRKNGIMGNVLMEIRQNLLDERRELEARRSRVNSPINTPVMV